MKHIENRKLAVLLAMPALLTFTFVFASCNLYPERGPGPGGQPNDESNAHPEFTTITVYEIPGIHGRPAFISFVYPSEGVSGSLQGLSSYNAVTFRGRPHDIFVDRGSIIVIELQIMSQCGGYRRHFFYTGGNDWVTLGLTPPFYLCQVLRVVPGRNIPSSGHIMINFNQFREWWWQ